MNVSVFEPQQSVRTLMEYTEKSPQSTHEHFSSKNYVPTLFLFRSQKSTSFFGFPLFSNLHQIKV